MDEAGETLEVEDPTGGVNDDPDGGGDFMELDLILRSGAVENLGEGADARGFLDYEGADVAEAIDPVVMMDDSLAVAREQRLLPFDESGAILNCLTPKSRRGCIMKLLAKDSEWLLRTRALGLWYCDHAEKKFKAPGAAAAKSTWATTTNCSLWGWRSLL